MHSILQRQDLSVIEYVDCLIEEAITHHISDIHIEPYEQHCRIRFRRDGLLYEASTLTARFALQIITRCKVMASLNIAERRLPQDGRITWTNETKLDLRVSICPTLFGEKIVLRILNAKDAQLDINLLGFTKTQKQIFLEKISQPQGLIIVTGPTGSGKTTTLYSALHYLNHVAKNIVSIEDPVEIALSGINQVNVNAKIGLTFAHALRSLLRQDPDVVMLGEIRDKETALIAVQAAQTGHLVLATLHTNSAYEALARLQSMGIDKRLLAHSLSLVIAQRLLRKRCTHHANCNCRDGYDGRIGLFELMLATEDSVQETFWDIGLNYIRAGVTHYTELLRVLGQPQKR